MFYLIARHTNSVASWTSDKKARHQGSGQYMIQQEYYQPTRSVCTGRARPKKNRRRNIIQSEGPGGPGKWPDF